MTGTIGVLVEARERKLFRRCVASWIVKAGLWIDERLYYRVLQAYGE